MKIFTYIKHDSKRISRKNFKKIGGLELWKHLIYELLDFEIFIDTDSPEVISDCATDPLLGGVKVYERQQRFVEMEEDPANKLSPALLMVDSFLDKYVEDEDEPIVLTHVTSPFLKKQTVIDAVGFLNQEGYDSVHSTYSIQDFSWKGQGYEPINFDPSVVQRTQDLEEIHFSNGAFFIFTKKTFKEFNNRFGEKTYYYSHDKVESVEIDTEQDLSFARIIYRGLKSDER